MLILKLRRHRAQEVGRNLNIAVAHDDQIIGGCGEHALKAVHLGIWIWRFTSHDQPSGNVRILLLQFADNLSRRIVPAANRKKDFERRVVLLEKGAQMRFKIQVQSR